MEVKDFILSVLDYQQKALHDLEDKVFTEWFPSTGYEHDNKPEMEIYLPGDPNAPDYRCQFWEPVIKKNSK